MKKNCRCRRHQPRPRPRGIPKQKGTKIWFGHCRALGTNHFSVRPTRSGSKRNSHAPLRLIQSTPWTKLRCRSGRGYSGRGRKVRVRIGSEISHERLTPQLAHRNPVSSPQNKKFYDSPVCAFFVPSSVQTNVGSGSERFLQRKLMSRTSRRAPRFWLLCPRRGYLYSFRLPLRKRLQVKRLPV